MASNIVDIIVRARDRASDQINSVTESISGLDRASRGSSAVLKGVAAGALATAGAMAGIATAGFKYNAMIQQADASWTTLLGSQEQAQKQMAVIQNYAKKSPFDVQGINDASIAMKGMGLSMEQVNSWIPTLGNVASTLGGGTETIKGISLALGQMNAKGKVSAEEMAQLSERGIDAWGMLSKAMGKPVAEIRKMSEEGKLLASDALPILQKGMEETFGGGTAEYMKSTAGQLDQVKESFSTMAGTLTKGIWNSLGTTILPAINTSLQKMNDIFSGGLADGFKKVFSSKVGLAITMIAGAITGALIPGLIAQLPLLYAQATAWAATAVAMLPYIAIATAIAGLAWLLITNWDTVKTFFLNLWTKITEGFDSFKQALATGWEWLKNTFNSVVTSISTFISNLITKIATFVVKSVQKYLEFRQRVISTIAQFIAEFIGKFVGFITTLISKIINFVVKAVQKYIEFRNKVISTVVGFIADMISKFNGLVKKVITIIGSWISNMVSLTTKGWAHIISGIVNFVSNVKNNFTEMIGDVKSKVSSWVSSLISQIAGFVTDFVNKIVDLSSRVKNKFSNMMREAKQKVTQGLENIISAIRGWFDTFTSSGKALLTAFKDGITQGISKAVNAVKDGMSQIRDFLPFSPSKRGALHDLDKSGESFFPTFAKGVEKKSITAVKAVDNGMYKMKQALQKGESKLFHFSGKSPLSKYFNAIIEDGDYMNDWITHLPLSIRDQLRNFGKEFARLEGLQEEVYFNGGRSTVVIRHEHSGSVDVKGSDGSRYTADVGKRVADETESFDYGSMRQQIRKI